MGALSSGVISEKDIQSARVRMLKSAFQLFALAEEDYETEYWIVHDWLKELESPVQHTLTWRMSI